MHVSRDPKVISALAACLFVSVAALANFLAQDPQPSPTPSPMASPSASVTPSPTRAPTPTPTPLPGAQNFHQWGSITVFNGLPSDSVRAISQTPDGVMWFGTDNGLARFDGRRIQNFSLGEGESDRVLALKTSLTGELWIGTRAGAFVYHENRFQPVENTQSIAITAILLDADIYLGTDNGLVLQVTRNEGGTLTAESAFPDAIRTADGSSLAITSLLKIDGKLLAGTSGRGVIIEKDGTVSEFAAAPRPLFVNSLARGENGKLWFGSDAAKGVTGIFLVDGGSRAQKIPAPTAKVLTLEANVSGLWAGTERYGLFHIADRKLTKAYTFANTSGGLRSDTIFALFTDREGVLWIGTNRGVSRFDRQGSFQQTVSDIPNSNFIRTLYQAPGEHGLLYAGSNRGLFTFDRTKDTWTDVPAFRNKVVYAIRKRYESTIVVGGPDGLFDISGRKLLDGDVRGFAGFDVRDYAAIFGKGVFDITDEVPKLVVADPTVTAVGERWNKLWIGTLDRGLFSYAGKAVSSEADADKLKSGTIWGIWNISKGSASGPAYIAGQHGVFVVRDDGGVEQIIAAEDVRDVVERDGNIWAATTTRGLLHARRDERFGWLVATVGFEQGLPSEKAFSIRPSGNELIIATNRGVVTYKPGSIAPKLIPVRVLSQRVHDLSEVGSTVALEYPQDSLLVEVAGQSSRTFPEEFQYAFVLTNTKGETIDSRLSNDPQYAPKDLTPGEYVIESIAFNRDLLASEPLTIRFSVPKAPFPWTATALGVLLVLALAGLVWAFVEHRRMTYRNRELAAARFDLANEAERERRRIARDLHDQTLADLRNLMMKSDKGALSGPEFREEIESVSTDIRRICEDLSPSVLENVGLVAALDFLLSRTVENRRFTADESIEESVSLPLNVQLQIYRIAQEVLTNIARHSNAGLVEMNVDRTGNGELLLKIRDDGKPFQPDGSSTNGRGISNIRSRANLINAKVDWAESRDGGNVFSLRIGDMNERSLTA